jgi:hypothetical protein
MATSTLRADQGNGSYILTPIVDTVIEFKFAQPPICAALDAMPMTMLWARLSHQNSKLRRWNKNDSITAQDSDRSCFTTCCERIGGRLFSSFSAVRREGISSSIIALTGLAFEARAARCPSIVFDGIRTPALLQQAIAAGARGIMSSGVLRSAFPTSVGWPVGRRIFCSCWRRSPDNARRMDPAVGCCTGWVQHRPDTWGWKASDE